MMAEYERNLPGSADRILRLVEDEAEHRRGFASGDQTHVHTIEKRGQLLAALLTASGLAIAGLCAWRDSPGSAATIVVAILAGHGIVYSIRHRGSAQDHAPRRAKERGE
jgi:uncharacterized membrane protein